MLRSGESNSRLRQVWPTSPVLKRFCRFLLERTSARFENGASRDKATVGSKFQVLEVEDAEPLVGDLFRRRFRTDSFPDEPFHYVGWCELPGGERIVLGYVHYYIWKGCALCGGLVIDERKYRNLPLELRQALRRLGGMAEFMLRESFAMLPPETKAIWGRIGDRQSEVVCRRAGFEKTAEQYIFVVWRDHSLSEDQKQELVRQVAAIGPF